MENLSNLAKAVINVMKEVKGMEKNSRVGDGKNAYDGTKDGDVKEVFNEKLAENGLCILPIDIQEEVKVDRWEAVDPWSRSTPKDNKMYQSVFTKVKTKYLLLHETGESIELAGYGHGVDPQDKGAGKATTYALKNCLLYTFLTPVGKMHDTDNDHSKEITVPQEKKEEPTVVKGEWEPVELERHGRHWENALAKMRKPEELKGIYTFAQGDEKIYTEQLEKLIISQ